MYRFWGSYHRLPKVDVTGVNQCWAMDFMSDALFNGRRFRTFTIMDIYSRECLNIYAGKSITGDTVVDILDNISYHRGRSERIRVDNGPEFVSKALDNYSYQNNIKLEFSRPGKPVDNAFIESSGGSLRDECLNTNWFLSIEDAQDKLEAWRIDYNEYRPHSFLDNMNPEAFARSMTVGANGLDTNLKTGPEIGVRSSGGEMQRVTIGREIVRNPRVFLMDEPLSNLDAKLREEMRVELAKIHLDLGGTFFYVTHDQIEAMTMADRIVVLSFGKILQIGTPKDIYERPQNVFIAKFVESPVINTFEAVVEKYKLNIGGKKMICHLTKKQYSSLEKIDGKEVIFGIRPEDIEITRARKDQYSIKSEVYFSQSMGVEDILNLNISRGLMLRAIALPKILIKTGEMVFANINMERAHLFNKNTEDRIVC